MTRVSTYLSGMLAIVLLAAVGCVDEIERPEPPATAPLPTPTAGPAITAVPTATPTSAPAPTPSPTASPTVRPTLTATPPPTAVPVVSPTRAPTPGPKPTATIVSPPTPPPTASATPLPQLFLDVRGPADGITVRMDAVVVFGFTATGAFVSVSGGAVSVGSDGSFQEEVALTPGANVIEVIATDVVGNRESRLLAVTYSPIPPQPFLLLIIEPEDQSIVSDGTVTLSGRTGPEAVVTVRGVGVTVDDLGLFSTMLTLNVGPNIIDVLATNTDGRVLSAVIAVIYRPQETP